MTQTFDHSLCAIVTEYNAEKEERGWLHHSLAVSSSRPYIIVELEVASMLGWFGWPDTTFSEVKFEREW